jgi:hypothetical protein
MLSGSSQDGTASSIENTPASQKTSHHSARPDRSTLGIISSTSRSTYWSGCPIDYAERAQRQDRRDGQIGRVRERRSDFSVKMARKHKTRLVSLFIVHSEGKIGKRHFNGNSILWV